MRRMPIMTVRRSSGGRFERHPRSSRVSLLGIAACAAVLPLAAAAELSRGATITTVHGPRVIQLQDSSRVGLTRNATLQYRRDFARRRVLWLYGEASLEVAPGAVLALWTETAVARTTHAALTVRAAGLESTAVIVREGTVKLRALNEDNDPAYPSVTASAGQQAVALRMVGARLIPP